MCKYSLHSKLFNYEFNISFGFPRNDICDTCEIKAAEVDLFNLQLKEATKSPLARVIDIDTAVIAPSFNKNITGVLQKAALAS